MKHPTPWDVRKMERRIHRHMENGRFHAAVSRTNAGYLIFRRWHYCFTQHARIIFRILHVVSYLLSQYSILLFPRSFQQNQKKKGDESTFRTKEIKLFWCVSIRYPLAVLWGCGCVWAAAASQLAPAGGYWRATELDYQWMIDARLEWRRCAVFTTPQQTKH